MKTLLFRFFTENWQRKLASLILAIIIWFVVHHSITQTKAFDGIPVSIYNLPSGKTMEGLQSNGRLSQRISLNITGNKHTLASINSNDLVVKIDASQKKNEWVEKITKHNLYCKNSNFDVHRDIVEISDFDFLVKLSPLVKAKIPIIVSAPIGEAPKKYQFLDVSPYQLYLNVEGAEKVIRKLKTRGLKLTFNLNEITKNELDELLEKSPLPNKDEVHYFVPDTWKKIHVPALSNEPITIDDPAAKDLRIDFSKNNLVPIQNSIPVNVFFQTRSSHKVNPEKYQLAPNSFIKKTNGVYTVETPLYAKGVSRLFTELIKDRIQLTVFAPQEDGKKQDLAWSIQFVYPQELENLYVARVMSQAHDKEVNNLNPQIREDYLRNRFRSYMNKFRLYTAKNTKLQLKISADGKYVHIQPKSL